MFTVSELAKLSGISTRTLRFYEQKGLLESSRSEGNYRLYDQTMVDRLQKILFFKYFDFELSEIKELLILPEDKQLDVLAEQR
ncbi:MerR family transcriptional regulator, partial [Staphylococcus aureus]|nr:MerR family transcriptional regulator [Staphylococcus aureus]